MINVTLVITSESCTDGQFSDTDLLWSKLQKTVISQSIELNSDNKYCIYIALYPVMLKALNIDRKLHTPANGYVHYCSFVLFLVILPFLRVDRSGL